VGDTCVSLACASESYYKNGFMLRSTSSTSSTSASPTTSTHSATARWHTQLRLSGVTIQAARATLALRDATAAMTSSLTFISCVFFSSPSSVFALSESKSFTFSSSSSSSSCSSSSAIQAGRLFAASVGLLFVALLVRAATRTPVAAAAAAASTKPTQDQEQIDLATISCHQGGKQKELAGVVDVQWRTERWHKASSFLLHKH
jgi:hypothetical protein